MWKILKTGNLNCDHDYSAFYFSSDMYYVCVKCHRLIVNTCQ